jgi:flagellar hook-associated protein 1 FlgK
MASLLRGIALNQFENRPANDLLDKFDLLLDELSAYGDVKVVHRENGTTSVYLGTDELCRDEVANKLQVENYISSMTGEEVFHIGWTKAGNPISGLTTGSLNALMDLKDVVLPGYLNKLDELAVQIAQNVNSIHLQGVNVVDPSHGGVHFFNPDVTGVKNFVLSKEVMANSDCIVTSLTGATGDNQIALLMADLRHASVFDGQTLTEKFADIIYNVASDIKVSKQSSERSKMLSTQSDNFREAVKGVSINEETANLLRFQQSYQAAAKIISVADDIFKTIIGLIR